MATRNWSIRLKITSLVVAPLSALLALWIFATVVTSGPALNLLQVQALFDMIDTPARLLVTELQQERLVSAVYLAGDGDGSALAEQRQRTDQAASAFRTAAGSDDARALTAGALSGGVDAFYRDLDRLPGQRGGIDRRETAGAQALSFYTGIIESAFHMLHSATFNDAEIDGGIHALTTLGRGRELLSQVDAELAAVFTTGKITDADHSRLVATIGTERFLFAEGAADLFVSDLEAYQRLIAGDAFVRLEALQDQVLAFNRRSGTLPFDPAIWRYTYDDVVRQLRAFELATTATLGDRAAPIATQILLRVGFAGLFGLLAVVISVWISLRLGRSLIERLTGLRAAALDLAGVRLPSVVDRLRTGECVDVEAEVPPLEFGADEIGQVAYAFTEVQRTAIQSAVDEAAARRGLRKVFLNIARRSQALLHRQLAFIDQMEHRTTDPQELEALYRIDHLATRMRRHAEDLVILAGAVPGRGWRNPVPVIDVIRGAISEVEDYQRIDVTVVEDVAVIGRSVGDVIHLLAELLENAASFSPPNTRVHVAGQRVPNGYAIEIEDRGLGMTAEAIDAANADLARPPAFDPDESARLGLFVVAQLAARHGVRVQLRSSPYGGVTAVALLADALTTPIGGRKAVPAAPISPAQISPAPAGPAQITPAPAGTAPTGSTPTGPAASVAPGTPDSAPVSPARVPLEPGLAAQGVDGGATVPKPLAGPRPPASVVPLQREPHPIETADGLAHRRRRQPSPDETPARAAKPDMTVGDDGLPRRVRQASIAPQLRDEPQAYVEAAPRSPEQARALLSSLQRGTSRGRTAGQEPESASWSNAVTALYPITADDPAVGRSVSVDAVRPVDDVVHDGEVLPAANDFTPASHSPAAEDEDA